VTPTVWVAIVSVIIAAASLTYTVYDKRRALSKKIGWRLLVNAPLLPKDPTTRWKQITVSLDSEKVDHPRVAAVEFVNMGRVELKKDEIGIAPYVSIPDAKILLAEISLRPKGSSTPQAMTPIVVSDKACGADDFMLNPGDALMFRLLVEGGSAPPVTSMQAAGFRFVEIPRPGSDEERSQDRLPRSVFPLLTLLVVILSIFIATISALDQIFNQ
jgi:hypothetical protein